jgi:hypothetical protein
MESTKQPACKGVLLSELSAPKHGMAANAVTVPKATKVYRYIPCAAALRDIRQFSRNMKLLKKKRPIIMLGSSVCKAS